MGGWLFLSGRSSLFRHRFFDARLPGSHACVCPLDRRREPGDSPTGGFRGRAHQSRLHATGRDSAKGLGSHGKAPVRAPSVWSIPDWPPWPRSICTNPQIHWEGSHVCPGLLPAEVLGQDPSGKTRAPPMGSSSLKTSRWPGRGLLGRAAARDSSSFTPFLRLYAHRGQPLVRPEGSPCFLLPPPKTPRTRDPTSMPTSQRA